MHKRHNPYPLLCVLALTAATAGCTAQAAPPPKGPPPVSVTTAKVKRGAIATYTTFDGQVTPVYQTTLSTAEAGTVASVNVTEGDFGRAPAPAYAKAFIGFETRPQRFRAMELNESIAT